MSVEATENTNEVRGREPSGETAIRPTVTVVIPALNEARNLPAVARRMPAGIDEIVFVDGHSQDDTVEVARELWPSAKIVMQTRRGKGNALVCGFNAATSDIVVMIDADGSTDPAEITLFVDALTRGGDVAKGSRFAEGGGSSDFTFSRRLGNKALNTVFNMRFGVSHTDLCYGYMAFWRCHLDAMSLPMAEGDEPQWGDGFEIETLLNVRVATAMLRVVEVPSFESDRIYGDSHLNVVSDGCRVLRTILKERPSRRREYASIQELTGARRTGMAR